VNGDVFQYRSFHVRMCFLLHPSDIEEVLVTGSGRLSPAPGWTLHLDPAVVLRPRDGVRMKLLRKTGDNSL
jgi:hypothetical protein